MIKFDLHIGPNAWDPRTGHLYAIVYPDNLYVSISGKIEDLVFRYRFEDNPKDVRGLFVASDGSLFVGIKGCDQGSFGRTMRSTDQGRTFVETLNRCFWGIDQDSSGTIFIGTYHERGEPDQECSIFMTDNPEEGWINISATQWHQQTHVHGLAICPVNGWLYATLGDLDGLDGCWRLKKVVTRLALPVPKGSKLLQLQNSENIKVGSLAIICADIGHEKRIINNIDGGRVILESCLSNEYSVSSTVIILEWVHKFKNQHATTQYVGIVFKEGHVYLSDDNPAKKNPVNAVVYRSVDDGTSTPVEPEPVLINTIDSAWGAFFLRLGPQGFIWVAVRPFHGMGRIWVSRNGVDWVMYNETPEESLDVWRISHTFRDSTYGMTGDCRCLFSPIGGLVVPARTEHFNKCLHLCDMS